MKRQAVMLWGMLLCVLLLLGCGGADAGTESGAVSGSEENLLEAEETPAAEDGHAHPAAENNVVPHDPVGYCGNTVTTVTCTIVGKDGSESWSRSFWGDRSVALTDLLRHLDYSGELCRCLPEYTVDTEFGDGYGVSLSQGYARYDGGQVSLTEEQSETIRAILEWAKVGKSGEIMKTAAGSGFPDTAKVNAVKIVAVTGGRVVVDGTESYIHCNDNRYSGCPQ